MQARRRNKQFKVHLLYLFGVQVAGHHRVDQYLQIRRCPLNMPARCLVAVFNHVGHNVHNAVLQFLKLFRPFPDQPVYIQMRFYAVDQDRRGKRLCDKIDHTELEAFCLHLRVDKAGEEYDRNI
jgi:hypothetical protein